MNEIVKSVALPIASMLDLQNMGIELAKSGMLGIENPSAGMVVAMTCHLERISPIEFGRTYDIVKGKPAKKTAAMAKDFRAIGGKYSIVERTATRAAAIFHFEGVDTEWEFTMEMAKKACLAGGSNVNWNNYPENMLWARMMSNALNVLAPEIKYGLYTPEEVSDFNDAPISQAVPVAMDPVEAAKKVEAIVVDAVEIDYSRCPIETPNGEGGFYPADTFTWDQFPVEYLDTVLSGTTSDPAINHGHQAYIMKLRNN